ncbi:MAG: hypothetical protein JW973_02995 [Bacteroidales bacterium]|nr:hypothetical protein [Bacteroidales bacterium]
MTEYTHYGIVYENGLVDETDSTEDDSILKVSDADDGILMSNPEPGNFEWWYFDICEPARSILLKIVLHMGTDPLRRKLFPQLAVSVNTGQKHYALTRSYTWNDIYLSKDSCELSVKNEFVLKCETTNSELGLFRYHIKIDTDEFNGTLTFNGIISGWKPLGKCVNFRRAGKKGSFYWIVPTPRATVNGEYTVNGNVNKVVDAIGYHDHNAWIVEVRNKYFMDDAIGKWLWGKAYANRYTCVFMELFCKSVRLGSMLIADHNQIIHSSNNIAVFSYQDYRKDEQLKTMLPFRITANINHQGLKGEILLMASKILERKDLLEEVSQPAKWIIKNCITQPAYHGLSAKVKIHLKGETHEGFGNYEHMYFRGKNRI